METNRLNLTKITKESFDDLIKLYTCPIVRKYLGGPFDYNSAYERVMTIIKESPDLFWVLRDKDQEFVGIIELDNHHDSADIEVSYQLVSNAWGKGFAKEALEKVIDYSFDELKLPKVVAETQTKNLKSIKLLKNCGFKEVRKLERFGKSQSLFERNNRFSSSDN